MEKINELTSENIVQQNIERLKEIFPTAFSEGKLVVEELQALIGEYIQKEKEFYQMIWAGKTEAQREANKVSTGTLRPCKEESKDWDSTGNIFIEGDNLEVLKLLQKSYSNKIKMIYIDPPYNTGKDFVYKDNYKDNLNNYLELTGQTDDQGKKFSTNADSDGRYHSNWLNMMYPRLNLARNLLKDDGVIFISIDDNEQANLKKLCDEIFGEENFVANIVWQHSIQPKGYTEKISVHHNYNLMYCKSANSFTLGLLERTDEHNKAYSNPDNDPKGLWRTGDVRNALYRPNLIYAIEAPNGNIISPPENGWRWSKETVSDKIKSGEIIFSKDNTRIIRKIYLENLEGRTPESIWFGKEVGTTRDGTNDLKNLFEKVPFDTPKPVKLLKNLYTVGSLKNDEFVIDFFSGSGTASHAVMSLNAEDGGNRKCISVQLPELVDDKSDAFKSGYKTIAEITKERIRRAGEFIKKENKEKEGIENLDTGFRVFKLDSSNIQAWDTSVGEFEGQLDMFAENNGDHIKNNRTEEDVLFEILLKYGLELTLPIEEKVVGESKIYNIGFGSMYICLSDQIKTDVAKTIGEWHSESSDSNPSVIFKDSGFANDADKTNSVQTLRQAGIENVKSI